MNIRDHEVLGREYKRGRPEGGQRLIGWMIETRLGALPPRAEERLRVCSIEELKCLGDRLMDVPNLEQLLR
jgi:hypothetical protein